MVSSSIAHRTQHTGRARPGHAPGGGAGEAAPTLAGMLGAVDGRGCAVPSRTSCGTQGSSRHLRGGPSPGSARGVSGVRAVADASPRHPRRRHRNRAGCRCSSTHPPRVRATPGAASFEIGEWQLTWRPADYARSVMRPRRYRGRRGLPGEPRAAPVGRFRGDRPVWRMPSRPCIRSNRAVPGRRWSPSCRRQPELFLARRGRSCLDDAHQGHAAGGRRRGPARTPTRTPPSTS